VESVDYSTIFRSIALYLDHGMKGCSDENAANHRHVEHMNAVIWSL